MHNIPFPPPPPERSCPYMCTSKSRSAGIKHEKMGIREDEDSVGRSVNEWVNEDEEQASYSK